MDCKKCHDKGVLISRTTTTVLRDDGERTEVDRINRGEIQFPCPEPGCAAGEYERNRANGA